MMDLKNKRVLIVGFGRSGRAAAALALAHGATVAITDTRNTDELEPQLATLDGPVELHLGGHPDAAFRGRDLVVLSPSVGALPALAIARAEGAEITGELEVAARAVGGTLLAITGTNGKSTTTALTGALCAATGKPTFVGGNLGTPFCEAVGTEAVRSGYSVVEVSSFQLETVSQFHAHAAALLNISADHLERHGGLAGYAAMKRRIFLNQERGDRAIFNVDDPLVTDLMNGLPSQPLAFSLKRELERGAFRRGGDIVLRGFGDDENYAIAELPLLGSHNVANVMAALLLARSSGVAQDLARKALRKFRPLAHRMEPVGEARGLRFFDDSKATNVDSVVRGLDGFPWRVVLIAGGRGKGGDYAPLADALVSAGRAVVVMGEDAELIARACHGRLPVTKASSMEDAVQQAVQHAQAGDAVVLSPACASFDMFRNYAHRGEVFQECVRTWMRS
jgi:UDP-N-acetylmuramoylalanine--D-glutamate ligase